MRELLARIDSREMAEWIARDVLTMEDQRQARLATAAKDKLEGRVAKRKRR